MGSCPSCASLQASLEHHMHATAARIEAILSSGEEARKSASARLREECEAIAQESRERARRDGLALEAAERRALVCAMEGEARGRVEGGEAERVRSESALAALRAEMQAQIKSAAAAAQEELRAVREGAQRDVAQAQALAAEATAASAAHGLLREVAGKMESFSSGAFAAAAAAAAARERALDAREAAVAASEERVRGAWDRASVLEAKLTGMVEAAGEAARAARGDVEAERARLAAEGARLAAGEARLKSDGTRARELAAMESAQWESARGSAESLRAAIPALQTVISTLAGEKAALEGEVERMSSVARAGVESKRAAEEALRRLGEEREALAKEREHVEDARREAKALSLAAASDSQRSAASLEAASKLHAVHDGLKEEGERVRGERSVLARERDAVECARAEVLRMLHSAAGVGLPVGGIGARLGSGGGAAEGALASMATGATSAPLLSGAALGARQQHPNPSVADLQRTVGENAARFLGEHSRLLESLKVAPSKTAV